MNAKQLDNKTVNVSLDQSKYLATLGPELYNLIIGNMEKAQKMEDGEEKEKLVKEIMVAINKKADDKNLNDSTPFKYQNMLSGSPELRKDRTNKYDPTEKISEIIVSIVGLIILWVVSVFWNNLFLKDGTSTIEYVVYFIGGMYLFVIFCKNLLSVIKKIVFVVKNSKQIS